MIRYWHIKNIHTLYYRRLSGAPTRSPDLFLYKRQGGKVTEKSLGGGHWKKNLWRTYKQGGDPGRNRTYNRPLRRRMLYPVELRGLLKTRKNLRSGGLVFRWYIFKIIAVVARNNAALMRKGYCISPPLRRGIGNSIFCTRKP